MHQIRIPCTFLIKAPNYLIKVKEACYVKLPYQKTTHTDATNEITDASNL